MTPSHSPSHLGHRTKEEQSRLDEAHAYAIPEAYPNLEVLVTDCAQMESKKELPFAVLSKPYRDGELARKVVELMHLSQLQTH